ncbi:formate--phosphoribosylaminoimidazolecarboxamide ligase [Candidatus Peregrinibacteria bacterium]|nr:formate--phosphoribosylaminoimidazolecarboxamide ligase [Candidatus Peregrinibacteria bacterium]
MTPSKNTNGKVSKDIRDYKIVTLASHTALQILKGAKDEGFHTVAICPKGRRRPYESYGVADEIIEIESYEEFYKIDKELSEENAIMIPHGSFIAYLGHDSVKEVKMMYYGTRDILEWESDREMERKWLLNSKLNLPKIYKNPEDIDGPVIIKFHGAGGGHGYFLANTPEEFYRRIKDHPDLKRGYVIQEYIVGVPIYAHYFYSRLTGELEVMGFDKRYESNADSIGRISAKDQLEVGVETSYTITGNIPIVLRESLLPQIFEMGDNVVAESQKIAGEGLFGPFCLEMILDPNLKFNVFEISARIVAGTNPYTNGSPYTWLRYDVPMSTGRRIALDIRQAIEVGELGKVLG